MGNPLFAKKSMAMLLSEAKESGEHSLKPDPRARSN